MNERIKDLLVICGMPNEQILDILDDPRQSFYMDQFAKLIIRDCIVTIQLGIARNGRNKPEYIQSTKHVKDIKEHFGIE